MTETEPELRPPDVAWTPLARTTAAVAIVATGGTLVLLAIDAVTRFVG